jgi:hypothetical protein
LPVELSAVQLALKLPLARASFDPGKVIYVELDLLLRDRA